MQRGIINLCLGVYSFRLCLGVYSFRLSVCTSVRSCVHHVCEIYHKFFHSVASKFLKYGISHELHIRKHLYLDHGYLGRSASLP